MPDRPERPIRKLPEVTSEVRLPSPLKFERPAARIAAPVEPFGFLRACVAINSVFGVMAIIGGAFVGLATESTSGFLMWGFIGLVVGGQLMFAGQLVAVFLAIESHLRKLAKA